MMINSGKSFSTYDWHTIKKILIQTHHIYVHLYANIQWNKYDITETKKNYQFMMIYWKYKKKIRSKQQQQEIDLILQWHYQPQWLVILSSNWYFVRVCLNWTTIYYQIFFMLQIYVIPRGIHLPPTKTWVYAYNNNIQTFCFWLGSGWNVSFHQPPYALDTNFSFQLFFLSIDFPVLRVYVQLCVYMGMVWCGGRRGYNSMFIIPPSIQFYFVLFTKSLISMTI